MCSDCDVALVPELPSVPESEEPEVEIVEVLATGDEALILLVKSLFDNAGIPYMLKGHQIQDLFGGGRFGSTYNLALGPPRFFVRADDFERANALLDTLEQEAPPEMDETP